jgi:hypothetical protein
VALAAPGSLEVQSGDTIGLFLGGSGYTYYDCVSSTGLATDFFYYVIGDVGTVIRPIRVALAPQYRIDVSARLEPDADGDEKQFRDRTRENIISRSALSTPAGNMDSSPARDKFKIVD